MWENWIVENGRFRVPWLQVVGVGKLEAGVLCDWLGMCIWLSLAGPKWEVHRRGGKCYGNCWLLTKSWLLGANWYMDYCWAFWAVPGDMGVFPGLFLEIMGVFPGLFLKIMGCFLGQLLQIVVRILLECYGVAVVCIFHPSAPCPSRESEPMAVDLPGLTQVREGWEGKGGAQWGLVGEKQVFHQTMHHPQYSLQSWVIRV